MSEQVFGFINPLIVGSTTFLLRQVFFTRRGVPKYLSRTQFAALKKLCAFCRLPVLA